MVNDHRGDRELSSPMKVRELIALLKNVDPDYLIAIGAGQTLIVVDPRPGFRHPKDAAHEDLTQDGELEFSEPDRKFLRKLHIK
jgi:hypothetical protein